MRAKDKVEKYITMLGEREENKDRFEVVESYRSRYFKIGEKVLRVSDHIGKNSTGSLTIIVPKKIPDLYIVHAMSSGDLTIMSYEEVKEVIRVFFKLSTLFNDLVDFNIDNFTTEKQEYQLLVRELESYKNKYELEVTKREMIEDQTLFGVDINTLTQKQLESIKNLIQSYNKQKIK